MLDYQEEKKENGLLIVRVRGKLDTLLSKEFEAKSESILSQEGISCILLDFKDLSYINSAGLRVILVMAKKFPLALFGVQEPILEVLQVSGFVQFLKIGQTEEEALRLIGALK